MSVFAALLASAATGCSSAPSRTAENGEPFPSSGPAVVFVRPKPSLIELGPDFSPAQPAEVLADIKDFSGKINDVRLRFVGIPLEVPMENVGGSTWRALFTPRQLQLLAVSGTTIHYEAHVVARDEEGKTGSSRIPVDLAVQAPEIASPARPPCPERERRRRQRRRPSGNPTENPALSEWMFRDPSGSSQEMKLNSPKSRGLPQRNQIL